MRGRGWTRRECCEIHGEAARGRHHTAPLPPAHTHSLSSLFQSTPTCVHPHTLSPPLTLYVRLPPLLPQVWSLVEQNRINAGGIPREHEGTQYATRRDGDAFHTLIEWLHSRMGATKAPSSKGA